MVDLDNPTTINSSLDNDTYITCSSLNSGGDFLLITEKNDTDSKPVLYWYNSNQWQKLSTQLDIGINTQNFNINFGYSASISKNSSPTPNTKWFYILAGCYVEDFDDFKIVFTQSSVANSGMHNREIINNNKFSSLDKMNNDKYCGKIVLLSNDAKKAYIASDLNIYFLYTNIDTENTINNSLGGGGITYTYNQIFNNSNLNSRKIESMAINDDGSMLVIGFPENDEIEVYIFSGTSLDLASTITSNNGDYFGNSISINGINIAVSASNGGYINIYDGSILYTTNPSELQLSLSINLNNPITNLSFSDDGIYLVYIIMTTGKVGLLKINSVVPYSAEKIIINSNNNDSNISFYNNLKVLLNSDGTKLFRNINNSTIQYDISPDDTGTIFNISDSNNIFMNNTSSTNIDLKYNSNTLTLNSNDVVKTHVLNGELYYNFLTKLT